MAFVDGGRSGGTSSRLCVATTAAVWFTQEILFALSTCVRFIDKSPFNFVAVTGVPARGSSMSLPAADCGRKARGVGLDQPHR